MIELQQRQSFFVFFFLFFEAVFKAIRNAARCVVTHRIKVSAAEYIRLLVGAEIIMQSRFISAFKERS